MSVIVTRISYETQKSLLSSLKELKIETSISRLIRQMVIQCSSDELNTIVDLKPIHKHEQNEIDEDTLDSYDEFDRYRHERRDC
jgi:hypothetical protein